MKVLVIGAGVAGLSIAWRLALKGCAVSVLERTQPGRGATYASAGMIAATAETAHMLPAEAAFAVHSRSLWQDFASGIEAASGVDIAYRQDGVLIAATSPSQAEELRARAAAPETEFLSAAEAREKAPILSPAIDGALWAKDEAQVDNRALGVALARAAIAAGAKLLTNETVVRIVPRAKGIAVLTPFALHEADAAVLAAGAWSSQIDGIEAEHLAIRPVKGEMIALSPPSSGDLPPPLLWGHGIYLVPRGGRLLVGATVEEAGFDTKPSGQGRAGLLERAAKLAPAVSDWPVTEHWAGLRPASADGLPVIGPGQTPNLIIASGQFRNGILFAPAMALAVEQIILEQTVTPELAAFSPARFAG